MSQQEKPTQPNLTPVKVDAKDEFQDARWLRALGGRKWIQSIFFAVLASIFLWFGKLSGHEWCLFCGALAGTYHWSNTSATRVFAKRKRQAESMGGSALYPDEADYLDGEEDPFGPANGAG